MIKNRFNSEVLVEVTEITQADRANIETVNGLSSYKRFLLVALPQYKGQYGSIIFQNLNDNDKEKLFDMLDKELHEETYTEIENQLADVHFENERLREELEQIKIFI